jgi:hypothetical protein
VYSTLLSFAVLFYCCVVTEREKDPENFTYFNAIWYNAEIMTTLGLGDIMPSTFFGRVVTMLSVMAGILLSSLLIGVITNQLEPSQYQIFAAEFLKIQKLEVSEQAAAATWIQHLWRRRSYVAKYSQFDPQKVQAKKEEEYEGGKARKVHNFRVVHNKRVLASQRTSDPMGQLDLCVSSMEDKLLTGIKVLEEDLWDPLELKAMETAVKARLRERLAAVHSNMDARLKNGEEAQRAMLLRMDKMEQSLTAVIELQSQTKQMLTRLRF